MPIRPMSMKPSGKKRDEALGYHSGAHADLLIKVDGLERLVEDLRAELERAQQLATLGTIAAMVAHEVNNLMTPVLNYAQMAQAEPGDAGLVAKALTRAVAGAQHASRIATSMLTLARADPGTSPLHCDVASAVSEAIICVPRGTQDHRFTASIPIGLSAAITPVALQQVILNLLLNGSRAVGGKDGSVSVKAFIDAGVVQIEVQDTGP